MGGICPLHMGGDKCRGQSINGGTNEGGPNIDRLYHKLKVLLLLSCNLLATINTMQLIGYNCIKTR